MKPTRISHFFTDHPHEFGKMVTQTNATEHFVGFNKMVSGASQSQRDCILLTPTGCNPFRVDDICFTISQGSSFLATLGYMMESLWDSPTGARQAHDLKQTLTGNVAESLEA